MVRKARAKKSKYGEKIKWLVGLDTEIIFDVLMSEIWVYVQIKMFKTLVQPETEYTYMIFE